MSARVDPTVAPHDEAAAAARRRLPGGLGAWLLGVAAVAFVVLLVAAMVGRSEPDETAQFLFSEPTAAPPIELTSADGRPFTLATLRGSPALVFFGYTHCPDVCPTTFGTLAKVMEAYGPKLRAVFVTVDPERDTVDWLAEYQRYLAPGFVALTGNPSAIAQTADAWGVRYAKEETDDPDEYTMAHTALVYLVDAEGRLRAVFPFGVETDLMLATIERIAGRGTGKPVEAPVSTATPPAVISSPGPAIDESGLEIDLVSTSVWAGGSSPAILALRREGGPLDRSGGPVRVLVQGTDGTPAGEPVDAVAVQPPGVAETSWVATIAAPAPGRWQLSVTAGADAERSSGTIEFDARDPGSTARLGSRAPAVVTPTLASAGGITRAVSTDPIPDPRLYERSTADLLAAGEPFVLVVDSPRFKVSPQCGQALKLGRFLADRWTSVAFVHLEPLRYGLVSDEPVLEGSLEDPRLVAAADAWGIGGAPFGARSMPWVFVIDRSGIVRAKYEGVIGTEDVDVILAMLDSEA